MKLNLSHLLRRYGLLLYFFAWFMYFTIFWSQAFGFDSHGNLTANHINLWGDWAAHFTMGSSLAYRSLWLTDSPLLIGTRFSYPYFSDWVSAVLIKLGMPFISAFTIPSLIASCLLVVALYYFFMTLFKARSIALVASLIFLLNGGLGFVYFGQDITASAHPWQTFLNPPQEYTRIDGEGIKWLSVIDSMVIPQRAFAFGFPLTLLAVTLVYRSVYQSPKTTHLRSLLLAGLLLGVMPIIHMHSFLAAGIILSCWMLGDLLTHSPNVLPRIKIWFLLGTITLSLALPLFGFFFANQVHGFIKWYPGWLANEYHLSLIEFWVKNWALTPLLAVIGLGAWIKRHGYFSREKLPLLLIWLPFFGLFVIANLWLFQPFSWDNTKLIVWAAVGFSGLAGYVLVKSAHHRWGIVIVIPLFLITIASGCIDTYRIVRTDLHQYVMYSAEELTLADWVKHNTPSQSIWLTGTHHNHWLFNLTGRQAVMTYPGWLWTHGYNYSQVEHDVRELYAHPQNQELMAKYDITYVVVGPQEEREYGASKTEFATYYREVSTSSEYSIFQVN